MALFQLKKGLQNWRKLLIMNNFIIWITGKSKTGKSTIAKELKKYFDAIETKTYVLEGKFIMNLFNDIGFNTLFIRERIRRLGIISYILADAGIIPIVPSVSPIREEREKIKQNSPVPFIEVYLKCHELTRKSRSTTSNDFIDFVNKIFVPPEKPNIEIDTSIHNIEESVKIIIEYLKVNKYI